MLHDKRQNASLQVKKFWHEIATMTMYKKFWTTTRLNTIGRYSVTPAIASYDSSEPDSLFGVGRSSEVRHVDGLQQFSLGRVSIEVELEYGWVAERDQSNPADSRTVRRAVDVQRLDDHAHELSHQLEVVESYAAGRVEREHHISAVRTSYTRKMPTFQFQFQFISLIELKHQGKNSCTDRCPSKQ